MGSNMDSHPPMGTMALSESRLHEVGFALLSTQSPTLHLTQLCDTTTYFNTLTMIFWHNPKQVRHKMPNSAKTT